MNTAHKRDRHGFRGLPPPATFSLATLADDALLSELDVAAILRMSSNTVASWRSQPAHGLRWFALPNGFIRYRVADLRAFLVLGAPRKRKPKPSPAGEPEAAPRPRRARRAKAELPAPQGPAP